MPPRILPFAGNVVLRCLGFLAASHRFDHVVADLAVYPYNIISKPLSGKYSTLHIIVVFEPPFYFTIFKMTQAVTAPVTRPLEGRLAVVTGAFRGKTLQKQLQLWVGNH